MGNHKGETKVRIGRGRFRGRMIRFEESEDLRPTLSRIRDAVFSMVRPYVDSHAFADLCAGSGVMGFEACSMGFRSTLLLDTAGDVVRGLERNARLLEADVRIVQGSALDFVEWGGEPQPWLLFADPPYRIADFHQRMLTRVAGLAAIAPGSLYVAEHEKGAAPAHEGFSVLKEKRYGRVFITILEKRGLEIVDP